MAYKDRRLSYVGTILIEYLCLCNGRRIYCQLQKFYAEYQWFDGWLELVFDKQYYTFISYS